MFDFGLRIWIALNPKSKIQNLEFRMDTAAQNGQEPLDEKAPKVKGVRVATSISWRRIFRYVKPYRRRLSIALVCLMISSLIGLMVPLVSGLLVDAISGQTVSGRSTIFGFVSEFYSNVLRRTAPQFRGGVVNWVVVVMLGVFVLQAFFNYVQSYFLAYVGERVMADLRVQAYEHVQRMSLRFFNDRRVGEIMSRITNDVTTIQNTTTVLSLIHI